MIYIDPKSCNENLRNKVFANWCNFANQREEFQSIQWFTTEVVHPIQPDSHECVFLICNFFSQLITGATESSLNEPIIERSFLIQS